MNIIDWILAKRPGQIDEYDDRYEISHDAGEHSTLFKNSTSKKIQGLNSLGNIYTEYDGMDLFSSTFKISAINSTKSVEGVELVECMQDFLKYVTTTNPEFPEESIPFMYQAGIGIYALGKNSGHIYEWDVEEFTLTGEYEGLEEVFEEWLDAVE